MATTSRTFSPAQMAYMQARALFEVCQKAYREYELRIDQECNELGIPTPYGILPEDHPMMAEAQRLLDRENEARTLMYDAARNLFDWASETTFLHRGTAKQKAEIREMIAKVKKMAHVEKFFIELVDLSMKLDAR